MYVYTNNIQTIQISQLAYLSPPIHMEMLNQQNVGCLHVNFCQPWQYVVPSLKWWAPWFILRLFVGISITYVMRPQLFNI